MLLYQQEAMRMTTTLRQFGLGLIIVLSRASAA
jgi:hypothetical protein